MAILCAVLALSSTACSGGRSNAINQTYTVGGTINGLSGSGLVLASGADTLTVTAGAATFSMPTGLSTGKTYAVTVSTQPSGQTCTVANGTGTISSANVANIVVTCSGQGAASTYTLGGTIAGLGSSPGLVLANATDTFTVPAGATSFTMPKAVATGSTYAITVKTQPTGLTCTVANGSGTISSANVANVVITCADTAYSLGGTITGLGNNAGLVLANGSDTVSVSAGAASFTMPTPVAYTSSYAVTIQTQPAGLACTVTKGTGTMPAAAVTNVSVSCTGLPFTLGGTINGLGNFTGLVLTNGADTLTVSAGATTFTMPTPVKFGSAYSVLVKSPPAGMTCTVSNGSGNMPAANVTTVAVTCSDLSYTLGGTITGLTYGGLVLANGTDVLHVSSGATTFTMQAKVAYTSGYAVVIQTQPSPATCSVTNGSGTMSAGNVTNVKVTCTVVTYTVGGTISGLTATGLVLLNNGGDATTVSANATRFTMTTGVPQGTLYAITVKTQPGAETCTVSNGTGTVGAANITGVALSCAPWSTYPFGALYSFAGGNDGAAPGANLIQASDGNFYGVTNGGDVSTDYGTVFKITPTGTESVFHAFSSGADGANPNGALVQDSSGNFYGTTFKGGSSDLGTVFKITATGTETVLHSFGGANDGQKPNGGLTLGRDGNFYGTTSYGGVNAVGTVFKITPSGTETVLYSFGATGTDAARPGTALALGNDGNFYGTSVGGGALGWGTVFKITPAGVETVLHSFTLGLDGALPYAALAVGSDGNFYGTTTFGGTNNLGAVFKMTPAGSLTPLYGFAGGSDGASPQATLVQAADGNFYGTTTGGDTPTDYGTVFKITPSGTETVIYNFTNTTDGSAAQAGLTIGTDVSFYGAATAGGTHGFGTIFKITPQ